MTAKFVPYLPCHLHQLVLQAGQGGFSECLGKPGYGELLAEGGLSMTGFDDAGNLLGCAGFLPQADHRVIAWALLTVHVRPRSFLAIDRLVRRQLAVARGKWDRIEIYVDPTFTQSLCWAESLGFTPRARLDCFWPGRRAAILCDMISPSRREDALLGDAACAATEKPQSHLASQNKERAA